MLTALLFSALTAAAEEAPPIVNGQSTSDWPAVGALLMCYGNSCPVQTWTHASFPGR